MRLGHLLRETFPPPRRGVVPEQNALRAQDLDQSRHDRCSHRLESGRQNLDHQPAVVAIHHERRNRVALAVDDAVGGGVDSGPAGRAGAKLLAPTSAVDGAVGALQQSEPDLGSGRVECLSDEAAARVVHLHEAGCVGTVDHLTAEDPGMAPHPALGAAGSDPRRGHARSGRSTVAPRR